MSLKVPCIWMELFACSNTSISAEDETLPVGFFSHDTNCSLYRRTGSTAGKCRCNAREERAALCGDEGVS